MSVAARSALCSTRHSTISTKPRADAVSSGLSPSRFFASTWQPAWQSARATAEYPCHAAQCSGVSCSWNWKHRMRKNFKKTFGWRKGSLKTIRVVSPHVYVGMFLPCQPCLGWRGCCTGNSPHPRYHSELQREEQSLQTGGDSNINKHQS